MPSQLLYLITHAHTLQDRTSPVVHWDLSETGRSQAAVLAHQPFWPGVDRIVVSSEPKTRLTVERALAQHRLPVVVDARFDELHRPGWVEDYSAHVRHVFAHPEQSVGGWEPANHVVLRFTTALADLCQSFPEQTLALVGHGLSLSLYRARLLGRERADFDAWRELAFASVGLVDLVREELLQDFLSVAGRVGRG